MNKGNDLWFFFFPFSELNWGLYWKRKQQYHKKDLPKWQDKKHLDCILTFFFLFQLIHYYLMEEESQKKKDISALKYLSFFSSSSSSTTIICCLRTIEWTLKNKMISKFHKCRGIDLIRKIACIKASLSKKKKKVVFIYYKKDHWARVFF